MVHSQDYFSFGFAGLELCDSQYYRCISGFFGAAFTLIEVLFPVEQLSSASFQLMLSFFICASFRSLTQVISVNVYLSQHQSFSM